MVENNMNEEREKQFEIWAHIDAGKTTITEWILYSDYVSGVFCDDFLFDECEYNDDRKNQIVVKHQTITEGLEPLFETVQNIDFSLPNMSSYRKEELQPWEKDIILPIIINNNIRCHIDDDDNIPSLENYLIKYKKRYALNFSKYRAISDVTKDKSYCKKKNNPYYSGSRTREYRDKRRNKY